MASRHTHMRNNQLTEKRTKRIMKEGHLEWWSTSSTAKWRIPNVNRIRKWKMRSLTRECTITKQRASELLMPNKPQRTALKYTKDQSTRALSPSQKEINKAPSLQTSESRAFSHISATLTLISWCIQTSLTIMLYNDVYNIMLYK